MKSNKVNKYIIGFICYLIVIIGLYVYEANQFIEVVNAKHQEYDDVIGEITKESPLLGIIPIEDNELAAIEFMFATYARQNTGELTFGIKKHKESADNLFTTNIDVSELHDNTMYKIRFEDLKLDKDVKEVYFYINADESYYGNAVSLWYNSKSNENGKIFIDSKEIPGDLVYNLYYKKKKGIKRLY